MASKWLVGGILFVLACLSLIGEAAAQQSVPSTIQGDLSKDLSKIQSLIEQYNAGNDLKSKYATDLRNWNPSNGSGGVNWSVPKSDNYAVIVDQTANIKLNADIKSDTIAVVPKGAIFYKLAENENFYKIEISGKEGWIQKNSAVSPQFFNYDKIFASAAASSSQSDKFDGIISGLVELRDKWKNNPYIEADGFDISLGMPLSVNFSFKFK